MLLMERYEKSQVEFEHPAKGPNHCSQCVHFQGKTCEIVKGSVDPEDWCNKFKARGKFAHASKS